MQSDLSDKQSDVIYGSVALQNELKDFSFKFYSAKGPRSIRMLSESLSLPLKPHHSRKSPTVCESPLNSVNIHSDPFLVTDFHNLCLKGQFTPPKVNILSLSPNLCADIFTLGRQNRKNYEKFV